MPAKRLDISRFRYSKPAPYSKPDSQTSEVTCPDSESVPGAELAANDTVSIVPDEEASVIQAIESPFPTDKKSREKYRSSSGKRLTPYQWKVYDYLLTIPRGKITTYKEVALAVGGSPRSAGTALRNNPFAPFVPCHRVIASDLYIGGFFGEWAKQGESLPRVDQKRALLATEGVLFNEKGYLRNRQDLL